MSSEERRVRARVAVEHPCALSTPLGRVEGMLRQISADGAQVRPSGTIPAEGSRVALELDEPDGGKLTIPADVVHRTEGPEGPVVGLAFVAPSLDVQLQIERWVERELTSSGGGARRHPRVRLRAEVAVRAGEEVRGVMCDLSQGGLGLELDAPVSVGDIVSVAIHLGALSTPLELLGRVVHVRALPGGHVQAGVRFEDLAPERRGLLRDLLQFLVIQPPRAR